jgi:hypothetical protein
MGLFDKIKDYFKPKQVKTISEPSKKTNTNEVITSDDLHIMEGVSRNRLYLQANSHR